VPARTVPERLPWHEIVERMNWSHEGLERIVHPDGRQTLRASGRFVHLSALVTLANGEHRIVCFSDPQAVKAAFDGEPFTEATPTHGKDGHAAF